MKIEKRSEETLGGDVISTTLACRSRVEKDFIVAPSPETTMRESTAAAGGERVPLSI